VLFLGSDDWIVSAKSLAMAAEAISKHPHAENSSFVCGYTLDEQGKRIGMTPNSWAWRQSEHWWNRWRGTLPLPAHPGVLHRARMFKNGACFDETYRICADHKFLWENNFLDQHCWIDVDLISHQRGGLSQSKSMATVQRQERRRMMAELGRPRPGWMEPLLCMKDYLKYFKR
jgi:hypothetical protein